MEKHVGNNVANGLSFLYCLMHIYKSKENSNYTTKSSFKLLLSLFWGLLDRDL